MVEVPSVTRLSCALTHPGWNNDIPHHVIQPPWCLLAPSSRPLGSHIPGQCWSWPRHCPGGATLGLCWCQGKRIRSVPRGADVIHERCSAREPRACSAPLIAHQKAGKRRRRERRQLHPKTLSLTCNPWQGFLQAPAFLLPCSCWVGLNDLWSFPT